MQEFTPPRFAVTRYVVAATLVRAADGGAVVSIVLLAKALGYPDAVSGLLGAAITAPHLLGPLVARRLDTAQDARRVIAAASVLHGLLLGLAALLLQSTGPLLAILLLIASGFFGPLLFGGISSRLPALAGKSQKAQRRAQGWDVASYGISGTLGPALVAWVTGFSGPLAATLLLAGVSICGAAAVFILPRTPQLAPSKAATVRQAASIMWRELPLRRTLLLTVIVSFSVAALPIHAAAVPHHGASFAGTLVALYGFGTLAGALLLMLLPLRGDADLLTGVLALVVSAVLWAVFFARFDAGQMLLFPLAGIANSAFFAATLAARSEYAPPSIRGQIFVWVGACKIAFGALGTVAAGAFSGITSWAAVCFVACLTSAGGALCLAQRKLHPRPRSEKQKNSAISPRK